MYHALTKGMETIARLLAIAGGAILIVLIILNCLSIIGRTLGPLDIGIGPIRGIYDITELGMAAAVFAFLPWAQFKEAHARVDLFAPMMPTAMQLALDLLFNIAMTAAAAIIAWRLYLGMQDKLGYGETTLIAQIPVWQGYAAGLVGAACFALIAAFCVLRAARRLTGLPD